MTANDFVCWLKGFFDLKNPETITAPQLKIIQNHLNLAFAHDIDPSMGGDTAYQQYLQMVHDGPPTPAVKPVPVEKNFIEIKEQERKYRC